MSLKSEKVKGAVQTASKYAFEIPETLAKEIAGIENPKYRVAVVGKFQAGKSTLINHVFLGDNPILLEGCGLYTTAVTTEVEYGPSPRLEVYRWADAEKTTEILDKSYENPSQEELQSVTVGSDRVALAEKISKVIYYAANEALQQYTILDTPGIDDPNTTILQNTTYRIIPSCDLAILVVGSQMLDQLELGLLRKNLIKDGISRLMVLVSYRPTDGKTAAQRKAIVDTIRAQLADIGKEDIPVEMYCFNESIDDILCTAGEISLRLNAFLSENALAGREDHVIAHLRDFLNNCLLELASKIKAAKQSSAENAEFAKRVQQQLADAKGKCKEIQLELRHDFENIKRAAAPLVERKISTVFFDFKEKINAAPDLETVQKIMKTADQSLRLKLTDAVSDCVEKIEQDVRTVLSSKERKLSNIALEWDNFMQNELGVNGGFMAKIPSLLLELANIIVINALLPGGFIIALIGRLLQRQIPLLKELAFGNLLKIFLVKKAAAALDDAQAKTISDVNEKISNGLNATLDKTEQMIKVQYEQQAKTITEGLRSSSVVDITQLETAQAEIQKTIAEL
jgi:hypothetical protein